MVEKLIEEAREQATWDIPESTQQLLLKLVEALSVKKGKWKRKRDSYDVEYIVCSCCGGEFYDGENFTYDILPNYCCECGAKMSNGRR